MAAGRKLQAEIEKLLKKVDEGIEEFNNVWDNVHSAQHANQREKFEGELKTQIKKLQRDREQIKSWQSDKSVKDKNALAESRRRIEVEMERFKEFERDAKTKTYSKEGLSKSDKVDPYEEERIKHRTWIQEYIDKLHVQIDEMDADIEAQMTKKSKSAKKDDEGSLAHIHVVQESHRWHARKLEQLLRRLDNDEAPLDDLDDLRENVEYYVDENSRASGEFLPFDTIYESFNLEDIEDYLSKDRNADGKSDKSDKETDSTPSMERSVSGGHEKDHGHEDHTPKAPSKHTGGMAAKQAVMAASPTTRSHHKDKTEGSESSGLTQKPWPPMMSVWQNLPPAQPPSHATAATPAGLPPKPGPPVPRPAPALPPPAQPVRPAPDRPPPPGQLPVLNAPPNQPPPKPAPHQPPTMQPPTQAPPQPPLPSPPVGSPPRPQGPAVAAATAAATVPGTVPGTVAAGTAPMPAPPPMPPPAPQDGPPPSAATPSSTMPANGAGTQVAAGSVTEPPNSAPPPPPPPLLPPPPPSPAPAPGGPPSTTPSLPPGHAKRPPTTATGGGDREPPQWPPPAPYLAGPAEDRGSIQQQQAPKVPPPSEAPPPPAESPPPPPPEGPGLPSAVSLSPTRMAAALPPSAPMESRAPAAPASSSSAAALTGGSPSASSFEPGSLMPPPQPPSSARQADLAAGPSEAGALSPGKLRSLQLLAASHRHLPPPSDSRRNRKYVPRNPYIHTDARGNAAYPSQPTRNYEDPAMFEKYDLDTLFFIFYYQQGSYQQHLAAKELKKLSWRYHMKYLTWFQRHEEPRMTASDFERGAYVYFDHESGWCQRIKSDFTFEYQHLEDEPM